MKRRKTLFNVKEFLARKNIKEHTAYKVNVSYGAGNPVHPAILFMGFKNGNYCVMYANNYDRLMYLYEVYYLELLQELCDLSNIPCRFPPRQVDPEPLGSDW